MEIPPDIPRDWRIETIGAIADVRTGPFGSALHERDYVEEGTPIVTVEHLSDSGISHENLPLVSDADCSRLGGYSLRPGDILFSRVGSVDRNSIVTEDEDGWLFSGRLLRVRVLPCVFAPYLNHHFDSEPFKKRVRRVAVGQTMASLNTEILRSVYAVIPPIYEQQAIAEVLSDVDSLINSLEALIAKKQDIKRATMQHLLTGKTRLPGFRGNWTSINLGKIGSNYGGLTGKRKVDFQAGESRFLTFVSVLANVILDRTHTSGVHVGLGESQNPVLKGDLVFNTTSETPQELAMGAVMGDQVDNLYLNSFCFGFRIYKRSIHLPIFLAYFFRGSPGRTAMSALAQGSTRYNMSQRQFLALEITIPEYGEQVAIAAVLSDMDNEINALQRRLEKTQAIKRGMMQELLSGRVRLVAKGAKL